jgi:dihydroorotase
LSWQRAIECMSCGPADVLGIEAGSLAVGKPADVILIDPHAKWTVDRGHMQSRSCNTPLLGTTLQGRVRMVWVGGQRKFVCEE